MSMLRLIMALLTFMPYFADNSDDDDGEQNPDPDHDRSKFSPEQQRELNRIVARETRKAADKARADRDAELAAEREAAEAEAARKAAEAAGDFESVKTALLSEKETIESKLTTTAKERDDLLAMVRADVDAAWDSLPAEVREAYEGEDDDVLARKQHMTKMKKIIDRLAGEQKGGNPRPPKPDAGGFDLEAEKERAKAAVAAKF